jgi:hypothetical protein
MSMVVLDTAGHVEVGQVDDHLCGGCAGQGEQPSVRAGVDTDKGMVVIVCSHMRSSSCAQGGQL